MTEKNIITKIRLSLCLNQREFADKLGITHTSVSLYENGFRKPGFATIRKLLALAKKHGIKLTLDDIRPNG